jgi:MoxR-like ATPase
MRDGLRAEVVSARAFRRQQAGDVPGSVADLHLLARLAPAHPRLPAVLPAGSTGGSRSGSAASSGPAFDAVGGADATEGFVSELRQMFELYLGDGDERRTRNRLAEYGQQATKSILLFGPSGCGKTYLVRAFAGEYRRRHGRELPLFRLRLEEVYGKYVGESESRLAEIFDRAIEAQPSLLFCDEIDGLGMSRENITHDFRQEFAGHVLQQVDRLKEQDASLLFFGCTNRVWSVDLALLRRFDRLIPVNLPDEPTREAIFRIHLGRIAERLRSPDLDLAGLARTSHGLTPGDIQKVVSRAVDDLLGSAATGVQLTQEGLLTALEHEQGGQGPMHLTEWVRSSRAALTSIGQESMAAELDRMYGPYLSASAGAGTSSLRALAVDAWTEQPVYDLTYLRRFRG